MSRLRRGLASAPVLSFCSAFCSSISPPSPSRRILGNDEGSAFVGSTLGAAGAWTPWRAGAGVGIDVATGLTGGGGGRDGALAAGASKTLVAGSRGGTEGSVVRGKPPSPGAPSGTDFLPSSSIAMRRSNDWFMSLNERSIPSKRAPYCSRPVARCGLTTVTSGLFARGTRDDLRSVRLVTKKLTPMTSANAVMDRTIRRVFGGRLLSDWVMLIAPPPSGSHQTWAFQPGERHSRFVQA